MATISEYMSGKICEQIGLALSIMDDAPTGNLNGTRIGKALLRNVGALAPRKMKVEEAIVLIRKSEKCAIGERVCRCLHKEAPLSETVFLDELAVGMVSAGKARLVDVDRAIANVRKHHAGPVRRLQGMRQACKNLPHPGQAMGLLQHGEAQVAVHPKTACARPCPGFGSTYASESGSMLHGGRPLELFPVFRRHQAGLL